MVVLIIVSVVLVALTVFLIAMGAKSLNPYEDFMVLTGLLTCILAVVAICITGFVGFGIFSSTYKADILNKEYGSEYTAEEVFFAGDVIDIIRELDKDRIEVNGNLFKDENNE